MRIVRALQVAHPERDTHVTVGVFDGVHRGHQLLIGALVNAAHAEGLLAAVYTFEPHPLAALGGQPPLLLTTLEERAEVLAALGVDLLVAPPFTAETAHVPAAAFARVLAQHLRMVALWAGPDFALGYQREGTVARLLELGREMGFAVRIVEPLQCAGAWVNSSRVRTALTTGDIAWATQCLGRPYRLAGSVRPSGALAPVAGWLAISVLPQPGRLVPAPGVYACLARPEGEISVAALVRVQASSLAGAAVPPIDVWPLSPARLDPGIALSLDFLARLRERLEPDGSETLAAQMRRDGERAVDIAAGSRSGESG